MTFTTKMRMLVRIESRIIIRLIPHIKYFDKRLLHVFTKKLADRNLTAIEFYFFVIFGSIILFLFIKLKMVIILPSH